MDVTEKRATRRMGWEGDEDFAPIKWHQNGKGTAYTYQRVEFNHCANNHIPQDTSAYVNRKTFFLRN